MTLKFRARYLVPATAAIALLIYFFLPSLERMVMYAIPSDFVRFSINNPPPPCQRWRANMPDIRDPEPYELYISARKLWRSKLEWEFTRGELQKILRDVELAALRGDWGARALLATFYRDGLGPLDKNHVLDPIPEKAIEIIRSGVAAGQPWAHYDLAAAYEHGYGSVPRNRDAAWTFYLRAAQLGSPDAQLALAEAYGGAGRRDDENMMLTCAFQQAHGAAAFKLGMNAELYKKFDSAVDFYQAGARFGDQESAASLMLLFDTGLWDQRPKPDRDALLRIGMTADEERASRYQSISDALKINPDLKFGRLNEVLPLPPQALPKWNGVEDAIEPDGPVAY
jgi:TPR repeat protein